MISSFEESVKFLESFIPPPEKKYPGELGLKRMKYLVSLLDNPQLKYPTIHVGGTSGKGSTATIIACLLATKYKVGLHTSPHLGRINERVGIFSRRPLAISTRGLLIKKDLISDDEFVALLNKIIPSIKKLESSEYGKPSYFEILTAMAFLAFAKEKVDIAVVEVGMGGRYDATNVIRPLVAVLTNVGLDHTEVLGKTVEEIAKDKVGIIKPGIVVVSGVTQSSVTEIVKNACKENKASLSVLKRAIEIPLPGGSHTRQFLHHPRSPSAFGSTKSACGQTQSATSEVFPWLVFSYRIKKLTSEGCLFDYFGERTYRNLKLSLLGEHQVVNASLAIRAIEVLNNPITQSTNNPINQKIINYQLSIPNYITESEIRYSLERVFVPGRLEIIQSNPLIILDGAHNPDKILALTTAIKKLFPQKKVFLVLAIKKGKDAKGMISRLVSISDKIILTKFRLTTDLGDTFSYDPEDLYKIVKRINKKMKVKIVNDSFQAVKEAILNEIPRPRLNRGSGSVRLAPIKSGSLTDLILVTGSLYLVGEVKKVLSIK